MEYEKTEEYVAPTLSPRELIDTFPEAIPAIKRNLAMAKKDLPQCEKICGILFQMQINVYYASELVDENLDKIIVFDPLGDWIPDGLPTKYVDEHLSPFARQYWCNSIINPLKKRIEFLEMLLRISQIKNAGLGDNPMDIAKAKSYPVENLIKINSQGFACCPFHVDDTPSFRVYTKQNRFHCFSCNFDGDSIDFTQKFYNLDFKSAVKFLNEK